MAQAPDDPNYLEEEEEGGGPVKSFLEHLEDLRWMLIKCIASVVISMIVCLIAGNRLVSFLTWPLVNAQRLKPIATTKVPLLIGTNVIAKLAPGELGPLDFGTNHLSALKITPIHLGTNQLLGLSAEYGQPHPSSGPILVNLKNYSPLGAFAVALQLALYGGLVLAAPFLLFFIGQFVLPALKIHEKKFLYQVVGIGSFLFMLGVAFCYFIIMQVALIATVQFSQWMGFGADEWRAEDYIGFVCKFMLVMGLSFELPVVLLTLVKIGLLDYEKLSKFRSYFVVINLFLCAVVTPSGDPFTMLLMAVPLQMLYELSVFIAKYWKRKEELSEAAAP